MTVSRKGSGHGGEGGIMSVLWGGEEKKRKVLRMQQLLEDHPVLGRMQRGGEDGRAVSREEMYKTALEKSAILRSIMASERLDMEEMALIRLFIRDTLPTELHHTMFIPVLDLLGTEEQKQQWLPLAENYSILGTYAQTELGHGSNVQGIETTAVYDVVRKEFVLHSPTPTSVKWWPGALGKTSTHAVVYARLFTKGPHDTKMQDYGPHPFIVQLRDLETHLPLAGIALSDIGPKLGYNTMDNGSMRLDQVRIPRENLLMRYSKVEENGTFVPPPHPKIAYATMTYVRCGIIGVAGLHLAKAAAIAIRYGSVRRQFSAKGASDGSETLLMDYRLHQARLLPLLATSYAFMMSGNWMKARYAVIQEEISNGDMSSLAELHLLTSGMKALMTKTTGDGIEECRKCCGGNGYLKASGIPDLLADYLPACTYEGDNFVLHLQVTRQLMKYYLNFRRGKSSLPQSCSFLHRAWSNQIPTTSRDFANPRAMLQLFQCRAAALVAHASGRVSHYGGGDVGEEAAVTELISASIAHNETIILSGFLAEIDRAKSRATPDAIRAVEMLASLYAASVMIQRVSDFLETRLLKISDLDVLRDTFNKILIAVRPMALTLVDEWGLSDYYINSALGRKDGDVYRHLYQSIFYESLNKKDVADGIMDHMKPMMHSKQQPIPRL